jgi:hypothetical protein
MVKPSESLKPAGEGDFNNEQARLLCALVIGV